MCLACFLLFALSPEERAWMIKHNTITALAYFYTDPENVRNFNQRPGLWSILLPSACTCARSSRQLWLMGGCALHCVMHRS